MRIKESILSFPKQFEYGPEIMNSANLVRAKKFVVAGMGGSHLSADILRIFKPSADIFVYTNYGLPELSDIKDRLIILSSYSGNTEEAIDAFNRAMVLNLNIAVISTGGKLLDMAIKNNLPYIQLPEFGLQPRMALGLSLLALSKLLGEDALIVELKNVSKLLKPEEIESDGLKLAQKLKGNIPVIYSSLKNQSIAYNWKIKFNENTKTPAFCNSFPELNHNEMQGFDNKALNNNFYVIFLRDIADDSRISKRLETTEKLYTARGVKTEILNMSGNNTLEKILNAIILGDWASYHLALINGVNPEPVPMVEEFKKLINPL